MGSVEEILKSKRDFCCEKSASMEEIERAEVELGFSLASDYKEYLQLFGTVSCSGHDLTGISEDCNLNVVNVTRNNYKKNQNVKEPFYVIEETHIDGIVIWQTNSGEVFQSEYKGEPRMIYKSLEEYLLSF